mgnify:CR=1 FL=1
MARRKTIIEQELIAQIKDLQRQLKVVSSQREHNVPSDETDQIYYWIGRAIQRRRIVLSMRQEDLAAAVGLSRTSMANIEAGNQRSPVHVFIQIANALSITYLNLIERSVEMEEKYKREQGFA